MLIALCWLAWGICPHMNPDLGQKAKQADFQLPKGADDWDYIGRFTLKDGKGKTVSVKLFALDTDSVAEKRLQAAKGGWVLGGFYPNCFSLHAVYQVESGGWRRRELLSVARVRFLKVLKSTPQAVDLRFCPNFRICVDPQKDFAEQLKKVGEINKPFTKRLSLVDGVPIVK